jgi:Xaa-Pro aminopeptidase
MEGKDNAMLFNRSRAIQFMRQYDLDVLIATSPYNVTYFTDYFFWLDGIYKEFMSVPGSSSHLSHPSYAVFPMEGEPAHIVETGCAANTADGWVRDLHVYGVPTLDFSLPAASATPLDDRFMSLLRDGPHHATAAKALLSVLQGRGLTNARIGLEMEGLLLEVKDALIGGLPRASIKDCSYLIRLIRSVKSPEEIKRLTRAAEINEQMAMESLALARPGKPVADLVQHYRARAAELGADFDHFIFSLRGLGISADTQYQLREDDVMLVDFGSTYGHYFSDSGTTLALGEVPPVLLDKYQTMRLALEKGGQTMRPGTKASAIQAVMQDALKEKGIIASYPHGHGLGLEIRDLPIIVPNNHLRISDGCVDVPSDLPMEEGMINNLEIPLYLPGVGSLHVEKSFLITAEGSRELIPQNRSTPRGPATG